MLTPQQVSVILELLDRQLAFFTGSSLGQHILSQQEKDLLASHGIDYRHIYDVNRDLVTQNFHLGMLSNILGDDEVKKMNYQDLLKYITSGQHIPLSEVERATIDSIKMQSMSDIMAARGKIFQDINNVVGNELASVKSNQEELIREQVLQGTAQRKSRKTIAREIAKLTGDWSRNFDKSVQYISHTALNEGRLAVIQRRYPDNQEAKVYFQVQRDACQSCVKAYLTNGVDSEPKIFMVKELQANGTNIGKKQSEWKPVIQALHPHCRCLLTEYQPASVWDKDRFKPGKNLSNRPKIRIVFNGKEYFV